MSQPGPISKKRKVLSLSHNGLPFVDDESSIWHLLFESSFTQTSMNAMMDYIWASSHIPPLTFLCIPLNRLTWIVCCRWRFLRWIERILHSRISWTRLLGLWSPCYSRQNRSHYPRYSYTRSPRWQRPSNSWTYRSRAKTL